MENRNEYISDVYTHGITTGEPRLHRGATVIDDWQVNFADGGSMSGVRKGRDFWTDADAAWKGNKEAIAEQIRSNKERLAVLTKAYLVPRYGVKKARNA